MARAGARVEHLSPDPAESHQLLDHRLRSADVPRRHRRQAVCHALVPVEVVEIVSLSFVRHAQRFTPGNLWPPRTMACPTDFVRRTTSDDGCCDASDESA